MKSFFASMTLILSLNVLAQEQAPQSFTCVELYKMRAAEKLEKRHKIQKGVFIGGLTVFAVAGLGAPLIGGYASLAALSSIASTTSLAGLGTAALASTSTMISVGKTKETKALEMANYELSKERKKLLKYVHRKVPGVTDEEIEEQIKAGFMNGSFCPDTNLMTPRQIRKQIVYNIMKKNFDVAMGRLKETLAPEKCDSAEL